MKRKDGEIQKYKISYKNIDILIFQYFIFIFKTILELDNQGDFRTAIIGKIKTTFEKSNEVENECGADIPIKPSSICCISKEETGMNLSEKERLALTEHVKVGLLKALRDARKISESQFNQAMDAARL